MSEKPPDKMSLIFLKRTRQVMAVATRAALPTIAFPTGSETVEEKKKNATAELKALVGAQLVVRDLPIKSFLPASTIPDFIESGVSVAPSELEVVTTDLKQNIFLNSRSYFIDSDGAPQLNFDPSTLAFVATHTQLKITLPAPVAAETIVTILIYVKDGDDAPVPVDCKIKPAQPNPRVCVISVQLTAGTYQFLTLVQGFGPAVFEQTLT